MLLPFLLKKTNVIADIYVSGNGNDSNPGTSSLPIKTLSKLNTLLVSNKIVAFSKGYSYYGNIAINGLSGLNFINYGSGSNPILTSGKLLTGLWTQNGNIWSYQDDNFPSEITNVYQSTSLLTLGRTPKTGRLPAHTLISDTFVRDTVNTYANGYWDNAQIVCYVDRWLCQTLRVTSYSSNQWNFPSLLWYSEGGSATAPYGYFIQNHVNCLTSQGEWAYNNSTKTIYIYSTSQPSNISVTYNDDNIAIANSDHISINGLNFSSSNRDAINVRDSSFITITNSNFKDIGRDCINIARCHHVDVINHIANNTGRDFLHIPGAKQYDTSSALMASIPSGTIVYNSPSHGLNIIGIRSTGHGSILGKQGIFSVQEEEGANVGQTNGQGILMVFAYNVLIEDTHFIDSCYSGVCCKVCGNIIVRKNYISNPNMWLGDGGGIYLGGMNAANSITFGIPSRAGIITNNIVTGLGSNGFLNAMPIGWENLKLQMGIYLDDFVDSQEVSFNHVEGGNNSIIVKDYNYVHDNNIVITYPYVGIGLNIYNNLTANAIFENNTFILKDQQDAVYLRDDYFIGIGNNNSTHYTIRNNKYFIPFNNPNTATNWGFGGGYITFAQWLADQGRINWDRSGEIILNPSNWLNSTKPQLNYLYILKNTTNVDMVVSSSSLPYSDYIDLTGADFGTSRTIQPYGSLIIVRKEN